MKGKHNLKKQNKFSTRLLIPFLITPIIILKKIGDLVLFFGKTTLDLELVTYRQIISTFKLLLAFPKKQKVKVSKKSQVIFRRGNRISEWIKKQKSKIKSLVPKKIKLPYTIRILLIKIKFFLLGVVVISLLVLIYQIHNFVISLPNPLILNSREIATTTKIYDRNGKLLYEIYADKNRTPISLSSTPEIVKQATIAIEDKEFYNHQGYSLRGIIRAVYHNLTSDSIEGGSTITQQLVRSAFLSPEKTFARKLKEIFLSIWAEQVFTKDQILEMYLNQVPYGGTAWGIEAAAQTYFGKNATSLTLSESALLAGLPAAPSRFSPFGAHPDLAKARQAEVLKRMTEQGFVTNQDADFARSRPLNFKNPTTAIFAPHFVMYVKELLETEYGPGLVEHGGLRVTTTLDLSLQEMAQKVVRNQISGLKALNVGNGSALITNPQNGQILAMVGSKDYFDQENDGNVNITTSLQQPGSSIKVVNYAAALEKGFTAASILDDSPIVYKVAGLPSYAPVNYDGRFHGRVTLRTALASSYNVPAVKVLASIGVNQMIEKGRLMGITTWNDTNRFGLSLTLGGGEVTMLDMSKVYGVIAAGGIKRELNPFLKITDYKGDTLPLPDNKNPVQAVSSGVSFILSSILSDNPARTPAFGSNSSLVIPGKTVAVKTGTSDNKRDNWTIGYTPQFVVTVWVGNNDNSPMNPQLTSGITGAAPIWHEVMTNLLQNKPDQPFLQTEDVNSIPCYGKREYFIKGSEPKGGCPTLIPLSPTPTP